ncbi:MAG: Ppx/GppA family phosphatase [Bacteroidetes bacterium]|nr:Ppx/GppA family phosphatase [Bacteroidota bacterium]
MKAAIIDLGTNTFHLLVADIDKNDYRIILEERIAVRLGAGGINQNIILEDGMQRAVEALQIFKEKIDEHKIKNVFAFGTSALRNATNSSEVISKIKATTGIDVKIISGDEEALYIYEGVKLALNLKSEKHLIMDIGGGSVEFIIGNGYEIFWKQSIEIGAQRLLENFQKHDPILKSEIETLNDYFNSQLQTLFDAVRVHAPGILAGASGSFDTLSDIHHLKERIPKQNLPETELTIEGFEKIFLEIISKNRTDRMQIPGMIELRVDMIVVSSCLIKFILDKCRLKQIRVSSYSLKEGVLASLMRI